MTECVTLARLGLLACLTVLFPLSGASAASNTPRAVSTFECIGLYWSSSDGAAGRTCSVRYRAAGESPWREGLPLWFDERDHEYRGSVVGLKPGTSYEVNLALDGTSTQANVSARTWPETFPVARTIALPAHSEKTLKVDESGTAEGYVLYTGGGAGHTTSIDVGEREDTCVDVRAAYVILRGLTLRNPRIHGVRLLGGAHDVVIEECDISGWGRVAKDGWGVDYDAAIYSREHSLARVVVQRNRIHHPRSNANNWTQYAPRLFKAEPYHPEGPQAVSFFDTAGNHVFRYNTVWSDGEHQCSDIFGGGTNFSREGFPNRDSDIYGNRLSHCWDDAIESDGANANVRIWGNYISQCFVGVATATTSVGPLYVWRNVTGVMRRSFSESPEDEPSHGGLLKVSPKMGGGRIYAFHNTILQPPSPDVLVGSLGCDMGLGLGGAIINVFSRDNILDVRRRPIGKPQPSPPSDFDYDLLGGVEDPPAGQETHGLRAKPIYARPVLPPRGAEGKGDFALAPESPGYDAGTRIPNFNDTFTGKGPDIGAQEAGVAPLEFGAGAYRGK